MGMENNDTVNRYDRSLSLGSSGKIFNNYFKDGSTESLFEVDEREGNILEDLDYLRFISSSEVVFSKLFDHYMNHAVVVIDEVLKIRDEWVHDLPSFEEIIQ
ncbi:hypothetical protein FG386_000726 [Cryptosporidium ryanae]|uniref:uncharacterized protein n=1 Tax=Cryptosporidium ryanae TaxID=515981 RepID=UPI00351A9A84|nr:hypothetical protein FG386_000726 [Cryptosporidium ryanae]